MYEVQHGRLGQYAATPAVSLCPCGRCWYVCRTIIAGGVELVGQGTQQVKEGFSQLHAE
jgi:hypothetical protein